MRCEKAGRRELATWRRAALFVFFRCLSVALRALPLLKAGRHFGRFGSLLTILHCILYNVTATQ